MIDARYVREKFLKDFRLEGVPEEKLESLMDMVAQNLVEALLVAVLQKLPPEVEGEFMQAVEKGDQKEAERIMRTHIPDTDTFVQEEIRKEIEALKKLQQKNLG